MQRIVLRLELAPSEGLTRSDTVICDESTICTAPQPTAVACHNTSKWDRVCTCPGEDLLSLCNTDKVAFFPSNRYSAGEPCIGV